MPQQFDESKWWTGDHRYFKPGDHQAVLTDLISILQGFGGAEDRWHLSRGTTEAMRDPLRPLFAEISEARPSTPAPQEFDIGSFLRMLSGLLQQQ